MFFLKENNYFHVLFVSEPSGLEHYHVLFVESFTFLTPLSIFIMLHLWASSLVIAVHYVGIGFCF